VQPPTTGSQAALAGALCCVVTLIVLAAHWPALSARALSFDDGQYLTQNPLVKNPSWASVGRFLGEVLEPSTVHGYYQPLAMISLMIDYRLGGRADNLRPFHRTSLALHVGNTLLIIVLMYMLFGEPWTAAIVGLLFGVHPLTVEPIPWVGERKTLLTTFFALWCLVLYVRYARFKNGDRHLAAIRSHPGDQRLARSQSPFLNHAGSGGWWPYVGSILMYVLALMSKPTSTPVPVLLLLLDYWPLGRLRWRCVLEKLPFIGIGSVSAIITYLSQAQTAGVVTSTGYSFSRVPLTLCHNIVFYLYKIVWPANLSAHYPYPDPFTALQPMVLAGIVGTCILITALLLSLRWTRAPATGWLFFFLAIFPTMGVIGFTDVIASDKYAYLPSVGLLLPLAWLLGRVWNRPGSAAWTTARRLAVLGMALVVVTCETIGTRRYLRCWENTEVHFRHMLSLTPGRRSLHFALAEEFRTRAQRQNPPQVDLLALAAEHFRQALGPGEDSPFGRNPLLTCLAHKGLGSVLMQQGKTDEALAQWRHVLELDPLDAGVHNNLGVALSMKGQSQEAIRHYREALRLNPEFADAHNNLGVALERGDRLDEAIAEYREALRLDAGHAEAHNNLGRALVHRGRRAEAVVHYRQASTMRPNWVEPVNNLAWLLATDPDAGVRSGEEAVRLAARTCELTHYQQPEALDTLAAAYAETREFDQAAKVAQQGIDLAIRCGKHDVAGQIRERLRLYQASQPFRESGP
jgi:Flp pilus assembly protein TadD